MAYSFMNKILRVVITGAACTGKTSLVHELEHFGCIGFPERGTEYLKMAEKAGKKVEMGSPEVYIEMFKINCRFESEVMEKAKKKVCPVIVQDGTIARCKVYGLLNNATLPKEVVDASDELMQKIDIVFFLDFIKDEKTGKILFGRQGNPHRRVSTHNLEFEKKVREKLEDMYSQTKIPMVFVPSMPLQDRVTFVVKEIKKRFPWVQLEKEKRAEV